MSKYSTLSVQQLNQVRTKKKCNHEFISFVLPVHGMADEMISASVCAKCNYSPDDGLFNNK